MQYLFPKAYDSTRKLGGGRGKTDSQKILNDLTKRRLPFQLYSQRFPLSDSEAHFHPPPIKINSLPESLSTVSVFLWKTSCNLRNVAEAQ